MGTLERIRRTSPYVLAIFAVVFVGFMVASDANIGELFTQGMREDSKIIARINDKELPIKDFRVEVRNRVERQKRQVEAQGQDIEIDETMFVKSLWREWLDQTLIKQEAEKVGLEVTEGEVLDILIDNPPAQLRQQFTDTSGVFNKVNYVNTYMEIVGNPQGFLDRIFESQKQANPNMSEEEQRTLSTELANQVREFYEYLIQLEEGIPHDNLKKSMETLVNTSGSVISKNYLDYYYDSKKLTSKVEYFWLSTNLIHDKEVEVSDSELKDYYEKIKKYHKQKPSRKVKVVKLPKRPSKNDTLNVSKRVVVIDRDLASAQTLEEKDSVFTKLMKEHYSETHDFTHIKDLKKDISQHIASLNDREIAGPVLLNDGTYFFRLDTTRTGENLVVKASHILFKFEDGKDKDSLKREARKVLKLAKNGNDFENLARTHSEGPSGPKGGDLGYFSKGQMVPPFEKAAFKAEVGSIVGPVQTDFGYHIIKVYEKKSDELAYSEIRLTPTISNSTMKSLSRKTFEVKKKVEEGQLFDSVAYEFEFQVNESPFFEEGMPIAGISKLAFSSLAFETEVGEIIDPSRTRSDDEYYVIQVVDSRQAGVKSFEDLKDMMIDKIKKIKKMELLKAKAQDFYSKVKSVESLGSVSMEYMEYKYNLAESVQMNGQVPRAGTDYVFTTKAFTLDVGKVSEPIRGEQGYYIMKVISRNEINPTDKQNELKTFSEQLSTQSKATSYRTWFDNVKESAKVLDYRYKHYNDY